MDNYAWRKHIPELVVSTVTINILALSLPITTLQIYDRVLPSKSTETLVVLIAAVCVSLLFETVLRLARAHIISTSGAAFEREMTRRAVKHITNAQVSTNNVANASESLQRIQAIRILRDFHCGYALTVAIDFSFIFIYLALVLYIGGAIIFAPLTLLALVLAFRLRSGLYLRDLLLQRRKTDDRRYLLLTTTLNNFDGIKAFSLGNLSARQYEPLEYDTSMANFDVSIASSELSNTNAIFGGIMTAAVVSVGAVLAWQGAMSIGALIACVLLSGRMLSPLQRGAILWMNYQEYSISKDKFESLFVAPLFVQNTKRQRERDGGVLKLEDVALGQRETSAPLFKNMSAVFHMGDVVFVDAPNFRQSSLLLRMLSGAELPREGRIFVDRYDIHEIDFVTRSKLIGYVSAQSQLFDGTILENISCFGSCDRKRAVDAAKKFGIDRDVASLPNGWNTQIRCRITDEAPAGLRHRIIYARTVAARPTLVLLDIVEQDIGNKSYDLIISAIAALARHSVIIMNTNDENLRRLATYKLDLNSKRFQFMRVARDLDDGICAKGMVAT